MPGFGIVEEQGQTFEVTCPAVGLDLFELSAPVSHFPDDDSAVEFDPGGPLWPAGRDLNTNHSLAHIAHRCGFYDQAHFTKVFAKLFGITPGRFLLFSCPTKCASLARSPDSCVFPSRVGA
jgi:hypothetical protein